MWNVIVSVESDAVAVQVDMVVSWIIGIARCERRLITLFEDCMIVKPEIAF